VNIRTATDIGLVLRERRRALGLDQATLAKRIGASRQWVVEIERGKPRAEIGLVLAAFRALGLSLIAELPPRDPAYDQLFGDSESARSRQP
jgi:HTH-type transcriptional regulator/antitoxin HipB